MDFDFDAPLGTGGSDNSPASMGDTGFSFDMQQEGLNMKQPAAGGDGEDAGYSPPALDSSYSPPAAAAEEESAFPGLNNSSSAPAPPQKDHLAEFQEKVKAAVQRRDAEADAEHKKVRQKAEETLKKMQADREGKVKARKSQNKEDETSLKARNEALFNDGPVWDRVVSLVDLKDEKLGRKTKRMREVLKYLQTRA
ncbi:uncharacterized protein DIPPA_23659 [Diplonema papillatum]|nr:uncharacterized protein DIPPA_23659 [Diplonema papillatum]